MGWLKNALGAILNIILLNLISLLLICLFYYYFMTKYIVKFSVAALAFIFLSLNAKANDTSCRAFFTVEETGFGQFTFTNKSYCNSGQQIKFYWDFGDGSSSDSTSDVVVHQYKRAGLYTAKLTIVGKTDYTMRSINRVISVRSLCNYNFKVKQKDLNIEINLPLNNLNAYSLNYGDGNFEYINLNKLDFKHTYAKAGSYTISLYQAQKSNDDLCTDTVRKVITITDPFYCHAGFNTTLENDPYRTVNVESDLEYFAGKDSSLFDWDFGDGKTQSGVGLYKTSHNYAADNTYKISLKVSNTKYKCTDTFSMHVKALAVIYDGTITGEVKAYDSASNTYVHADEAIIYLIQYNEKDSTLNLVDSAFTTKGTGGKSQYTISSVAPGKYLVKTALQKKSKYYDHNIPTYYTSALKWSLADTVSFNGEKASAFKTASISFIKGNNTGGKGFIGGKVVAGANKKEGDPLQNVQIILYNSGKLPVKHTYTDKDGNFGFSNIAFGTYEIYTEVAGLKTTSAFVTLTQADPSYNRVVVKVSSDGVTTEVPSGNAVKYKASFIAAISIYPNPALNNVNITFNTRAAQTLHAEIYNINGKKLVAQKYDAAPGQQVFKMDVSSFTGGTYILLLKNASTGETARYRFVKM